MKGLHTQAFASIQLPSISGPINEGEEGRGGRGQRGQTGGHEPGVRRSTEWGKKRARAVIRKEFQSSDNKSPGGAAGVANFVHLTKQVHEIG